MSNVFFYEPFYDFERLFEEAFAARQAHAAASHPRVQLHSTAGQGATRAFKPRYAAPIFLYATLTDICTLQY